jgi:hypothetical protein
MRATRSFEFARYSFSFRFSRQTLFKAFKIYRDLRKINKNLIHLLFIDFVVIFLEHSALEEEPDAVTKVETRRSCEDD